MRRAAIVSALLALAACGKKEVALTPPPPPEPKPLAMPVSIDEVMVATVDFAADGIWRPAQIMDDGLTDQQWSLIEQDAITLIASATLITTPGIGVDDPTWIKAEDWQAWSKQMQDIAIDAREAAREKNTFRLGRAGNNLAEVCAACHAKYRPDTPRGPPRFPYYPKREGVPN